MTTFFCRIPMMRKMVRLPCSRPISSSTNKSPVVIQYNGRITGPKFPPVIRRVDHRSTAATNTVEITNKAVQLDIGALKQQVIDTFLWMNGKLHDVLSAGHVSPEEANSIRTVGGEQIEKVLALCDYVMASEKQQKEIITNWKQALKTDWEELVEVTKKGEVSEGSESENDYVAEYGSSGDADMEAKHGDDHPACLLARIKAFKKTCSETCVTLKKESHDPEALLQCAMVWGELGETKMGAEFIWGAVSTSLKNVGLKQQLLISSHTKLNVFAQWIIDNHLTAEKQKFREHWESAEDCHKYGFYQESFSKEYILLIAEDALELVQALDKVELAADDVANFYAWFYNRTDKYDEHRFKEFKRKMQRKIESSIRR